MDKLGPVAKSLGLRVPPAAPQGLIGTPLTPLRCFLLLTQSKYKKYVYQGGRRAQRQAQQEWKLNEFHDAQVLLIWPFRSLFWNAYGLSPFSNFVQFCNNLEKGLSFLSVKCSLCSLFVESRPKRHRDVRTNFQKWHLCLSGYTRNSEKFLAQNDEIWLHSKPKNRLHLIEWAHTFFQQPCPKRRIKSSTRDRNQCSFPINITQGIFDSQNYVWGV